MADKESKNNSSIQNFSNDATEKLLGYDYQKLIALEDCLFAKSNEYIWIECKGDIADSETSKEVKHHISANNITSNSVDIWNTLKNYVTEFAVAKHFTHLILHTTSTINSDSIFNNWNSLFPEEKRDRLVSHAPSETIKTFFNDVCSCSPDDLLNILSKFYIKSDQPNIKLKWEELKEHPALTIIKDNFKDAAIQELYGYITKQAINNSKEWKININDFKKDFQNVLYKFTTGNTPFPIISKNEINICDENKSFVFIKKMKEVKLKEKVQEIAFSDYILSNMSLEELLLMSPTLNTNLEIYDKNIKSMLENKKTKFADKIEENMLKSEKANEKSRDLYFEAIEYPHENIIGVDNTQGYYKNGRIHHITEVTDFKWKFEENDL